MRTSRGLDAASPPTRRSFRVMVGGLAVALAATTASAVPATPAASASVPQVEGTVGFAKEFADPAKEVLPSARYWVASGVGDPAYVKADIEAMADNGIGSATYNDLILAQAYDTSKSFGTKAWSDKLRAALETANERDFRLDLLISPGWSAGSDRVGPDDEGASKVLAHGRSQVLEPGEAFTGQLPLSTLATGATKRKLQGVLAVRCATDCTGSPAALVRSSVVDLTDRVAGTSADGTGAGLTVDWTAPAAPADGKWLMLAFWSQGNALRPTASIDGALRNVYQVDHYSKAGTAALIDPWNEQVLDDDLRARLAENGGSMWLDSVELHDTNWTDSFLEEYENRTGRSYVVGLPTVRTEGAGPFVYDDDSTRQYRSEWTRQLTNMFIHNQLDVLKDWSHSLGMKLRYQSYFTIGPADSVIPDEAWAELDVIDAETADSRGVAAVGAMAGKNVNYTECCAFLDFGNDSWRQRWTDMLFRINQSFSTGANAVEYHGFSQSHAGDELFQVVPGLTNGWPGWNPFVPVTGIAESWDTRQPAWEDQGDINRYVGRNQLVLQTGRLRSDFGVYTHGMIAGESQTITDPAVARHGYSWGYLSDKFVQDAVVKDGVLYSDGPRYKALVLDRTTAMPVATARRIVALAKQGLPVVVLGDAPSAALEAPDRSQDNSDVVGAMSVLLRQPGVIRVPGDTAAVQASLPEVLSELGVDPLTAPAKPSTIQTITRQEGATTYTFVLNTDRSRAVDTDLRVAAAGRPYALDSWTGAISPIATYDGDATSTTVPLRLAPGATTIIAVTTDESALGVSRPATSLRSSQGQVVSKDGALQLRSTQAGTFTSVRRSGRSVQTVVSDVPAPVTPAAWTLDVESWGKPATGIDTAKTALPPVNLETDGEGKLPSWRDIASPVDLRDVSGLGTYRTTVDLGADWDTGLGAYLDLGRNFQTYSLVVNGTAVDGENQVDTSAIDLGSYLRPGVNEIVVRVSTTLRNAIISQAPEQAGGTGTARQAYGLTGPVTLTPYRDVPLALSPARSSLTLTTSATSQRFATSAPVTLRASVGNDVSRDGTVRFYDGTTELGAVAVANGVASLRMPALTRPGRHTLTARFEPASEEAAHVTSPAVTLTVKKARSVLSARLVGKAIAGTRGAKLAVRVRGPRGYVGGKVVLRLPDGRRIAKRTERQSGASRSKVTFRLPALKRPGAVRVKVAYAGNANVAASRTAVKVTVRPRRR
jgi:hypothetical protein